MTLDAFLARKQLSSFIGNQYVPFDLRHSSPLISPVTHEAWKSFTAANEHEIADAIRIAHGALPAWQSLPPPERAFFLRDIAYLLHENKKELALAMAMEMGKPIAEGELEVEYAAGFCEWFAGEAERIYGLRVPSHAANKIIDILPQAVGVVGIITPWNFPIAMLARKAAAALAAGCTIVCKPSPECPVTALAFAEILHQVGVPQGVINVVIGDEDLIGRLFLSTPEMRHISFTGSVKIGRYLYSQCAQTLKTITLELGGHAPLIVFDDADIDVAVHETIKAKFRNNGQTCVAPNRIYVHQKIFTTFRSRLIHSIQQLNVGNPLIRETNISIVVHPSIKKRVKEQIDDAIMKGASPILKGQHEHEPVVLERVTSDMKVYYEETFGPLVPLITFEREEEVIRMANDSQFGLAAYFFTKDLARAHRVAAQLEYGIIGVNDGLPSAPEASFGGVKNSGFGREGGPHGIREFLRDKTISMQTVLHAKARHQEILMAEPPS